MTPLEQYWKRLGYNVTEEDLKDIGNLGKGRFRIGHNWMKISFNHRRVISLNFPGVYIFINKDKKIIYVGSSINLENRLLQHRNLVSRQGKKQDPGLMVYVRKNKKRNEHLTLEMNLIQRLHPQLNRMGRTARKPLYGKEVQSAQHKGCQTQGDMPTAAAGPLEAQDERRRA